MGKSSSKTKAVIDTGTFDYLLRIDSETVRKVAAHLGVNLIINSRKYNALSAWLANIAIANQKGMMSNYPNSPYSSYSSWLLRINLNTNKFSKTIKSKYKSGKQTIEHYYGYHVFKQIHDVLVDKEVIKVERKGFFDHQSNYGLQTIVTTQQGTSPEIYKLLESCVFSTCQYENISIKDGSSLNYKRDGDKIKELNAKMKKYKRLLESTEFKSDLGFIMPIDGYISFRDNRLKTSGKIVVPQVQFLPQKNREKWTIGGEKATEVDFTSAYPSILYLKQGLQLPARMYPASSKFQKGDYKTAMLICMNTEDERAAKRSIARNIFSPKSHSCRHKRNSSPPKSSFTKAEDIIKILSQHHHEIWSHVYNSGRFIEPEASSLMLDIVSELTSKKIPCIPITDCVMGKHSDQQEIKIVMNDCCINKYGQKINLKIEY